MKKILSVITLVVAMGALMFMQSCKKEETGSQIFYATIQQYEGDKVYIDELYSCWEVGDSIRIGAMDGTVGRVWDNNTNSYRYRITIPPTGDNGYPQGMGWNGGNGDIGAIYPASLWRTTFNAGTSSINRTLFLEPTQLYEEVGGHQKLLAPMVAVLPAANGYELPNENNTLEFKNICALLKVTVNTDTRLQVTRIEVENTGTAMTGTAPGNNGYSTRNVQSGRPLWGNFEVAYTETDDGLLPILREESDVTLDFAEKIVTKEVTLECEHHGAGGVDVNGTHPFYIFLPPVGYDQLHVTVYALVDGHEKCKTLISSRNGTFAANTIYPLGVSYDNTWITVPRSANEEHQLGPYTVGANTRVEFSFANLHKDNDGYYFPPYQYDFIGYHDPNGDHDHFTSTQLSEVLTGFQTTSEWTTLTANEWNYLLGPIDAGTVTTHRGGTYRFVTAIVASVPGIILFPDDFTSSFPSENAFNSFMSTITSATAINNNKNKILSPYVNTIVSIPDFYLLEHEGCVFLPCVFYRSDDEGVTSESVSNVDDKGYYWENSTTRLLVEAGSNSSSFTVANDNVSTAFIRLVKNYTPRTE